MPQGSAAASEPGIDITMDPRWSCGARYPLPLEGSVQTLSPKESARGRVVFFVPRWLPEGLSPSGMPYKAFPVLSSLARHGFEVDLFTEVHDGLDGPALREALGRGNGAVAWCAELNPGVQIPGLLRFLEVAAEENPSAPRVAGGGFFALAPSPLRDLGPLADAVLTDSGVGSVARVLLSRLGGDAAAPAREGTTPEPLDTYSVRALDLRPFLRPESMLFRNDLPALQIPTGLGCAKHCAFCFYERTQVRLLPAEEIIDLVGELAVRYGVRQFLFGELDFFTSRRRSIEVARGLIARKLGVRWFALVSVGDVARLSEDDLDAIAESGCHILELGTEVGSDAAIRRIGKRFSVEDTVRGTERLLARGIVPLHNMMLGFPGETARDRRETVALVDRLRRMDGRVRFNFRVYQAVPNTTMGEEALRSVPDFPRTFAEIRSYRERMPEGRSMPWLSRAGEREAKLLADYLLPLACDDALLPGPAPFLRRCLRRVARARSRLGFYRLPVDRALFSRFEKTPLPGTFLE